MEVERKFGQHPVYLSSLWDEVEALLDQHER